MKQALYPLHKQNVSRAWQENTFLQAFRSVPIVVKSAWVNAA